MDMPFFMAVRENNVWLAWRGQGHVDVSHCVVSSSRHDFILGSGGGQTCILGDVCFRQAVCFPWHVLLMTVACGWADREQLSLKNMPAWQHESSCERGRHGAGERHTLQTTRRLDENGQNIFP